MDTRYNLNNISKVLNQPCNDPCKCKGQTRKILTVRLPFTLCLQDTSELQRLAALNGVMGLLGSEQTLFIVSKLTKHRFILEKIIAGLIALVYFSA